MRFRGFTLAVRTGFRMPIGLTDAAMGSFAKARGRGMRRICKGQRQQLAAI
jgi:hypothetical protein